MNNSCLEVVKLFHFIQHQSKSFRFTNQTVLYYAAREGKTNLCEYLIDECKIPVDHVDINGQSPLFYALR